MAAVKVRLTWITANDEDLTEHAVTDEAQVASWARGSGVYEGVCGAEFVAASMDVGPGRRCPQCVTFVRARAELRDFNQRLRAGRRRRHLPRLLLGAPRGRHAA